MQWLYILFSSVCFSPILSSADMKYSNQWSVQIDGGSEEADRLARKHGFVNEGKVIGNYYSFQHQSVDKVSKLRSTHVQGGLASEPNVKMVEQQVLKTYKLLSKSTSIVINDTRWGEMWYMNREDGPTYNVIEVWKKNITGHGVVVAVVDEGFDPDHPEIKDNYDEKASFDLIENDTSPISSNESVPQYGHGENCAGVIAAVVNNSNCGAGLAYNAQLGGIRLFFEEMATDLLEARALSYNRDYIDIYSNSWGPGDIGFEVDGPGKLTQLVLKEGAENGRGGRGSIFVFAAGNGGIFVKDSCAFNGYVNNIYTIAITGINRDGSIPSYGEHCAGIMAVTYSRDIFGDTNQVVTAGLDKTCEDNFRGSSAAAAMASGLIALTLNTNPKLSWRDVQHIIVRSARPAPVKGIIGRGWTLNNDSLKVNDYVGFGLMDASKMVTLASNWTTVPNATTCTIPRLGVNKKIYSSGTLEETINLTNRSDACSGEVINYLEHVEVKVNLNYSRRGDLLIKITSPKGTVSNLTHYRLYDSFFKLKELNWTLMTLHLWGETAVGEWKLTLENSQPQHDNEGILFDWTLILHGTTLNPLDKNRHVFANTFTVTSTPTTALSMDKTPTSLVSSTSSRTVTVSSSTKVFLLPTKKISARTVTPLAESPSTRAFSLPTKKMFTSTVTPLAESSSTSVFLLPTKKTSTRTVTPLAESSSTKVFSLPTKMSTRTVTPLVESSATRISSLPTKMSSRAVTPLAESSSTIAFFLPTKKIAARKSVAALYFGLFFGLLFGLLFAIYIGTEIYSCRKPSDKKSRTRRQSFPAKVGPKGEEKRNLGYEVEENAC